MRLLVPIGRVPTARTRVPYVVATVGNDLRLGQVSGHRDPFARIGSVLTWTEHRVALLAQWLGPELYDQRLLEATRSPRYSLQFFLIKVVRPSARGFSRHFAWKRHCLDRLRIIA